MSEADVTTVVLRFRDLGMGVGQTIAQHQERVTEFGFTWWAWWDKAGEQAPIDLFRRLNTVATTVGLDVFLYDSGQDLLWEAKARAIQVLDDGGAAPSPQAETTPAYYRAEVFKAWFRFESIRQIDADRIRDFSYVQVDSFFQSGTSRFAPFYGKRVDALDELLDQNRTIWFVRRFRVGDREGRIGLFDSLRNEPTAYPAKFIQSASARLLWLSDIHLSNDRDEHAFPVVAGVAEKPLAQALEPAAGQDKLFGGLLVSGDLTWRADPAEFARAHQLIGDIRSWSRLEASQVGLVPGNHDLRFSPRPFANDEPITETWEDARAAYAGFYETEFFQPPNQYLSMGRRYLLRNAVPVEVVFLNSSTLQQAPGQFQGHGFIGDAQMEDAAQQMRWDTALGSPRPYRVVVLHHHVMPITYRMEPTIDAGYSTVLDAEALMRWLARHRVDIVLHGHMHQPAVARVSRPVDVAAPAGAWHEFSIVAMGSTGAAQSHLGEIGRNTFGIIDFSDDVPTVTVKTVHPTNPVAPVWSAQLPRRP